MSDLVTLLQRQGVTGDLALELLERKSKTPSLQGLVVGGRYVSLDAKIDTSRVNAMLDSGVPPAANTDREFLMGSENGRQFQSRPEVGNAYKAVTEREGGSVTGKKYISQLARYPGDPEAWVSGRGDVAKILEQRGWGCDGAVKTKVRERDTPPSPGPEVAEDIVERETHKALEGQTVTKKEYLDTKEKVKNKIKPKWKKK